MTSPIGVFDSGLGGLTVARQIMRLLPNETIIYFADTAHVPYGERRLAQIEEFALGITRFLVGQGAKAIVMACNMSSAVALEPAREAYAGIPILGVIEPGSRAAVATGCRAIGVLATTGTVGSRAYTRAIQRLDPQVQVWEQACPAFVPLVEAGLADTEEADVAVRECVEPLVALGAQALILGCTHYPFLGRAISRAARDAHVIDPAEETVRQLQKLLAERRTLAGPETPREHRFFASGETEVFSRLGGSFLGREISRVERAAWGRDVVQLKSAELSDRVPGRVSG